MEGADDELPWTTPAITILFGMCSGIQIAFSRASFNVPQRILETWLNQSVSCESEWLCKDFQEGPSPIVTLLWSVVIAVSFIGDIPAGLFTRWLCSCFGRKWLIFLACWPTLCGLLLQGTAGFFRFWFLLLPGRLIHALGATSLYLSVKYYSHEIYPVSSGPRHLSIARMTRYLAESLVMISGLSFTLVAPDLWWLITALPLVACGLILLNILSLPETPRFLIRNRATKERLIESIQFYFGEDKPVGHHQGLIIGQEPVLGPEQRGFRGIRDAWRKNSEQRKAIKFILVSGAIGTVASSAILTMFSTEIFSRHLGLDDISAKVLTVTTYILGGIFLLFAGRLKWIPKKNYLPNLFTVSLSLSILALILLIGLSIWIQYGEEEIPTEIDVRLKVFGVGMITIMICAHRFGMVRGLKRIANERLGEHVSEPTLSASITLGQTIELFIVLTFLPITRFLGPAWGWFPLLLVLTVGLIYLCCCCPKMEHKERLPLIKAPLKPEERSRIHHIHKEPQRFRKKPHRPASSTSQAISRDATPPPTSEIPGINSTSLRPLEQQRSASDSGLGNKKPELHSPIAGSSKPRPYGRYRKRKSRERTKIAQAFRALTK